MKTADFIDLLIAYCVDKAIPFTQFEKMVEVYKSDELYYEKEGFESLERAIR